MCTFGHVRFLMSTTWRSHRLLTSLIFRVAPDLRVVVHRQGRDMASGRTPPRVSQHLFPTRSSSMTQGTSMGEQGRNLANHCCSLYNGGMVWLSRCFFASPLAPNLGLLSPFMPRKRPVCAYIIYVYTLYEIWFLPTPILTPRVLGTGSFAC